MPDLIAALLQAGRAAEAEAQCRIALKAKPGQPDLLFLLAQCLAAGGNAKDAAAALEKALARAPQVVQGWAMLGSIADRLNLPEKSVKAWGQVARLSPSAPAWFNLGNAQRRLGKQAQAADCYEKAHAADPDDPTILSALIARRQALCLWDGLDGLVERLIPMIRAGKPGIQPFRLLALDLGQDVQLKAAETAVSQMPRGPRPDITKKQRIVVGYLSADFHTHATAWLMAELFECHDRQRFEIHGFSTGPDDGSAIRRRVRAGMEHFHDLHGADDRTVFQAIRSAQVDLLIDLKGHTRDGRLGVLAMRPAPVQASWLGYPGTTGADFIDYVIGDTWVLPQANQKFYSEKFVHLPHSYQCNDRQRPLPDPASRKDHGFPEQAVILGCFNAPYKYGPKMFDLWMGILAARPNVFLWLMGGEAEAERALAARAKNFGVGPRVKFARHLPLERHLARYGILDLTLDTLPYNAHTTGSDSLWMGCPMVTCPGESFAARVGASLVDAAGLPDLIAQDLADYQAKILELIDHPDRLKAYRRHLESQRLTLPLFDTPAFARALEAAFRTMLCSASS